MEPERRVAAIAAVALLVTMFFPWYGLQSVNRKTGAIYSHNISAFGDVSFVEAAIFLVAAGVLAILLARAEGRRFHLPGGDGMIVMLAGCWAGLLIFYRVFDRPTGSGYPVGIEWGFFLAFVAAGGLAYAGWRMHARERPGPPLRAGARRRPPEQPPREQPPPDERAPTGREGEPQDTVVVRASRERTPVAVSRERKRGPYPPAPEQLSFEDPPTRPQ
jgi:hypothetical protein